MPSRVSDFRAYFGKYSPINTTLPALSAMVTREAFSLFLIKILYSSFHLEDFVKLGVVSKVVQSASRDSFVVV